MINIQMFTVYFTIHQQIHISVCFRIGHNFTYAHILDKSDELVHNYGEIKRRLAKIGTRAEMMLYLLIDCLSKYVNTNKLIKKL